MSITLIPQAIYRYIFPPPKSLGHQLIAHSSPEMLEIVKIWLHLPLRPILCSSSGKLEQQLYQPQLLGIYCLGTRLFHTFHRQHHQLNLSHEFCCNSYVTPTLCGFVDLVITAASSEPSFCKQAGGTY